MVTNLRHVGLVVNDLDKLILFYNKLGFKVVDRKKEEGSYIEKQYNYPLPSFYQQP